MNNINNIREEIDTVDREILKQLNKRLQLVHKIKEIKRQSNISIEDKNREEEIVSSLNLGDLDVNFVKAIYQLIFSYSKDIQSK